MKIYLYAPLLGGKPETVCAECALTCFTPPLRVGDPELRKLTLDDVDDEITWRCVYCGDIDEDLYEEAYAKHIAAMLADEEEGS